MAQQIINVGSAPNDGTGDTLRSSQIKANANFTELYTNKLDNDPTTYTPATLPLTGTEVAILNNGTNWVSITWNNIKAQLKAYFDTLYQSTLVSGTNIKTINGTSILGSGDLVVSGGGSVDISPKATNSLIVNGGLNGVTNIGYFSYGGLTGGSFAYVAGAYIRALSVTNMRSTAATAGSFTALRWEGYHGIGAKSKLVGFFAIGSTVAIADSRTFAGYYQYGFSLGNINYSAAAYAGFLNDTGDVNLQFCRVVSGGGKVKTDLGANFPARYTDGQNEYKFLIEIVSTSTVNFKIKNLVNGAIASGSFTDLDLKGAPLIGMAMNNNTTAVQTNLKFHSLIYQEDYEF